MAGSKGTRSVTPDDWVDMLAAEGLVKLAEPCGLCAPPAPAGVLCKACRAWCGVEAPAPPRAAHPFAPWLAALSLVFIVSVSWLALRPADRPALRVPAAVAESARAACEQGKSLRDAGQYQAAIASFEQALRLDAGMIEARYALGDTLRMLRRYEEATAVYQAAPGAGAQGLGIIMRIFATLGAWERAPSGGT